MRGDGGPSWFHESQKLRQWHVRILLALPPAALVVMTVRQVVFHHPWGQKPPSNGGLIFLTVLLALVYLRLITVRLVTDLGKDQLSVGLRGLWPSRRIPLSQVRSAKAITYDPVRDYGGYGIRSGRLGAAYIASGNRAVQLELASGRKILVGSQRADELAAKLSQAKAGRS